MEAHLSLAVVERLQALFHQDFRNPSPQLRESHGFLLGRMERRGRKYVVFIEDFEPFDPGKMSGVPPVLARPGIERVGLYRSISRDSLHLDQLDAALIESIFRQPGMLYLLVRPSHGRPSAATFFVQEDGMVRGYESNSEFPFHAEMLRTGDHRTEAESERGHSGRRRAYWLPVAGLAAALILAVLLWARPGSHNDDAPAPAPATTHPSNDRAKPSPTAIPREPDVVPPRPPGTAPPRGPRAIAPAAVVTIEPVEPRASSRWFKRLPGMRALRRNRDQRFQPARAVRSTPPTVPSALSSQLRDEAPVDLRIAVNRRGRVERVRVIHAAHPDLAELAVDAADRWRFEPARLGKAAVPSELVLHFRFRPATTIASR